MVYTEENERWILMVNIIAILLLEIYNIHICFVLVFQGSQTLSTNENKRVSDKIRLRNNECYNNVEMEFNLLDGGIICSWLNYYREDVIK